MYWDLQQVSSQPGLSCVRRIVGLHWPQTCTAEFIRIDQCMARP